MLPVDGFFLKPLLSHGKEELRQYLISNNLTWREVLYVYSEELFSVSLLPLTICLTTQDSSNSNRKYKRNKLRLDVIPLLHEIAGGQEALQDRLLALEEQSKHVQQMVATDVRNLSQYTANRICP
jgi:tRNA(Ile)-lysidine synthase TilS/MesJ